MSASFLPPVFSPDEEYPLTVRQAAKYLGVSPQTVYLWVERKQIPHLRVMGRNIQHDGVVYARKDGKIWWIRYWDRNGKPCRESSGTADWDEANRKLRERLHARGG